MSTRLAFTAGQAMRALALCSLAALATRPALADEPVFVPLIQVDSAKSDGALQTAVLAGGCFWGVEAVFEHLRGVRNVVSGYAGGKQNTAQYDTVTSGRTGHAESVQVTFDPREISYGELLRVFMSVAHDPTQLNRQGPDTGTQYRSVIFYANDSQKDIATWYVKQLNDDKAFPRPVITRVDPLPAFYPAEGYHQDFIAKNPRNPYVVVNDLPKIRNLKQEYPKLYRDNAAVAKSAT